MKKMIYKADRETEVLCEGSYLGYNFVIVSYGTHPCAYVEIPKDNPFYLVDYDKLEDDITCHGGLTYSGTLDHIYNDLSRWFIGWDYAHAGDYNSYSALFDLDAGQKDKKWTTEEIYEEVMNVVEQLRGVSHERQSNN